MNRSRRVKILSAGLLLAALLRPELARACATCYGASDSPLAEGMNWGILSLLAIVGCVLGGVSTFFVFIAKRSATVSADLPPLEQTQSDPRTKP